MLVKDLGMEFKVRNLNKRYKDNQVIENFSYDFKSGLYLLTGKNGSGKSTLLKLITNIISSDNKDSFIDNRKIAYLCEKVEVGNSKVLTFLTDIKKLNYCNKNIKEIMKKWQLPNKTILTLSKGNKQKCALIMMFITDSDIYLFDEPTDALDQVSITNFIAGVKELIENNKIVIISTHEKEYFKSLKYVLLEF